MIDLWVPDTKLHLPPPRPEEFGNTGLLCGTVELGAWNKQHKLIQQFREPSHSPVKQFLQMVLVYVGQAAITVKRTDGTGISATLNTGNLGLNGLINTSTKGIRVGTGTTAVDMTDVALVAAIVHGTSSGQLVHQAVAIDADVTVADPISTFVISRNFNNNSGGSITVGETALYSLQSSDQFCLFRDVPTSLAVPDGGGAYVKYTLKITE